MYGYTLCIVQCICGPSDIRRMPVAYVSYNLDHLQWKNNGYCTQYTVQCTVAYIVYRVQCTLYSVHCEHRTLYSVEYTERRVFVIYSVQYIVYSVHYILCTLYSVYSVIYTIHYIHDMIVYTVHYTLRLSTLYIT